MTETNQTVKDTSGKPSRIKSWMERSSLGLFVLKVLDIKMIRFFMVAGLNTAFGYALFAFLIFIGLHYTVAALVGQIIGILFNFRTYGALVFKNKKKIIRCIS